MIFAPATCWSIMTDGHEEMENKCVKELDETNCHRLDTQTDRKSEDLILQSNRTNGEMALDMFE